MIRLSRFGRALGIGIAAAMLAGAPTPVAARKSPSSSNAAPVHATVTVSDADTSSLCLLVEGTDVDFGEARLSAPEGDGTFARGNLPTVLTNCSPSDVVLTAKGSKAVADDGSADWSLLGAFGNPCAAGFDLYNHFLVITDPPTEGGLPLTEAHQTLQTAERPVTPPGQHVTVDHGLVMPCEGSGGNGRQMNLSVQFLAVFP